MRKLLLASVIALAPFAAFAGSPQQAPGITGNIAFTGAASGAVVGSTQGTMANSMVKGDGVVINGAVAGNYTSVATTGHAQAGPLGTNTKTTATQTNIGGAITGGYADAGRGWGNTTAGSSSAMQQSAGAGGSIAAGANLGGFVKVEQPKPGHGNNGNYR